MSAPESPKVVTGRPPKAVWRPVPEDRFPVDALLRLLFSVPPASTEKEGGGRGSP